MLRSVTLAFVSRKPSGTRCVFERVSKCVERGGGAGGEDCAAREVKVEGFSNCLSEAQWDELFVCACVFERESARLRESVE